MSTAPAAPRPDRRFRSVVAAFAVANLLAWVAWDRYFAAAHRGVFHVESVDADASEARPVRWHFDADVIPTDAYARPPGRVVPAVAGRWAWESPRTLAFVPAVGLPRATAVTFTLAGDLLRTGTGARLAEPVVTRVDSDPLAVKWVRQSAVLDDGFVVELAFTDRVAPGDVLAHLAVTRTGGYGVACHLLGQATGNVVRVRTDPLPVAADGDAGALTITLSPGLIGAAGPLGLARPFVAEVPLERSLAAVELTASSPTRGRPALSLSFNGEVDAAALRPVLSLDPPVPFTLAGTYQGVQLSGDFHPGTRYTVKISAPPPGTRGRYPRPGALAAFVPDLGRDCWFDADQGYLSTAGTRTLIAHVVNVNRLHVTVTRVYDDNLVAWRNDADRDRYSYRESADTDAFARPAADRRVDCPGRQNDRRDVRLSLDDLLPPGPAPQRRVAGVGRAGRRRVGPHGLGRRHPVRRRPDGQTDGHRRRRLGHLPPLGQPLAGVRVRAYTDKNQLLDSATTGPDGLARLINLRPAPGESVAVLLADAGPAELTWLDLKSTAWDLADADVSGRPYHRAGQTAFVYADRGVYRPGETVHLRAIVREAGDVKPWRSFPVRWRFRRPDLHDWQTVVAMLDADGATAADVPLPADLPTGQWSADVALPGPDAVPFGSATFAVEDFVPNRLKVGFTLGDGPRYAVGDDPLPADVRADYLFGRPAAGLAVDLSAHATPAVFAPAGWAGWTFGDAADARTAAPAHHKPRKKKVEPPAAAATLDDAGRYHGTVDVADLIHVDDATPGRFRGPWRVTADAAVREAGGRAVTVTRQVDVDALPAYVGIRRTAPAVPGQPCPFALQLVKPDGAAAGEATDLTVRLLRESWNTTIAFRDGQYRYDSTRLLDPVVTATVHLDGTEARWSATPPDAGRYVLEATAGDAVTTTAFYATDGTGWDDTVDQSHPDHLDVRVLGPGEPDVPGADTRTRPAAAPQRVGTTARVLVAAPFAGRLLLTVETDDVVQSRVIDMTASHVVVPVDVTAACRPGAFVTATVLRPVDPAAAWKPHRAFGVARLNVDPADRRLTVALSAPAELRPMRSLDVGLTVTGPDGRPVANAAATVAAVDEGICSLTDFTTPDPLAFFTARPALGVTSADVFGSLMPDSVGGDGSGSPLDAGGRHRSPVGGHRVRPVALAWDTVHTDAAGHARGQLPRARLPGPAAGDGRRLLLRPGRLGRPRRDRPFAAARPDELAPVRRPRRPVHRAGRAVQQHARRGDGRRHRRAGRRPARRRPGRDRAARGRRAGSSEPGRDRRPRRRRCPHPPRRHDERRAVRRGPGTAGPPRGRDDPGRRRRPRHDRRTGRTHGSDVHRPRYRRPPRQRHALAHAEPAQGVGLPRPLPVRVRRADDQHPVPARGPGRDRTPRGSRPVRAAARPGQGPRRHRPPDRHADGRRRAGHVGRRDGRLAVGQRLRGPLPDRRPVGRVRRAGRLLRPAHGVRPPPARPGDRRLGRAGGAGVRRLRAEPGRPPRPGRPQPPGRAGRRPGPAGRADRRRTPSGATPSCSCPWPTCWPAAGTWPRTCCRRLCRCGPPASTTATSGRPRGTGPC